MTPFSPRSLDRGLAGTLVALARQGHVPMTPALGASQILTERPALDFAVDVLGNRAYAQGQLTPEEAEALRQRVRDRARDLLDEWSQIALELHNVGGQLQYQTEVGAARRLLTACRRRLWIDERGTSGDLAEVYVRCACGQQRSMTQAARPQDHALGNCDGARPWLGPYTKEACGEPNRLLIRTASNAYFPQVMSVISLPDRDETVKVAVDAVWEFLAEVEDLVMLRYERRKARVHAALEGLSDDEVCAEIQARRGPGNAAPRSVKWAELETLVASSEEIGEDRPDGNFFARPLPRNHWDQPWMEPLERVILVHRLREVVALVGFMRFEALAPDIEGELEIGVRRAALARATTWLPAIENKGEGIFLQFKRAAVESWLARTNVQQRGQQLNAGFECWRQEHQGTHRQFPGLPYIMLHSFAHLLITAVSLECGYPASSIRERIYALPGLGYGVLLYTGTTDAEGTLGGIIQVGRHIHEHV